MFIQSTGTLLVISDAADDIDITSMAGQALVNGASPQTGPLAAANVQGISVIGGQGGNDIDLSGVTAADFTALVGARLEVDGGDGADTITASSIGGQYIGGHGDDLLNGDIGADSIDGDDGHDTINGSDGDDVLDGEDGNDVVDGGAGNDTIIAGDGEDSATGGDGNDSITGDNGSDTLSGDAGDDFLNGGFSEDLIDGGDGNDTLFGGADADSMLGSGGDDQLTGNAGDDTLDGGDGTDTLSGGVHNDLLSGGTGNDSLNGDVGDDVLTGGDDADTLDGGDGNDMLNGEGGNDLLMGGPQNDLLSGGDGDDTALGQGNDDTVIGGDGADLLEGGAGNDFVGSDLASFSIDDTSVIEGDTGTTPAVFMVTLSGVSATTTTVDFATADGTATGGLDYVPKAGTLTFAPGQTSQMLVVDVIGDTLAEPDETFFVNLSNPMGALIGKSQGVGTIIDDDGLPVFPMISIDDVSLDEGDTGTTDFTFTVSLSAITGATVSVDFTTEDRLATSPADYMPVSGTVTIPSGMMSQTITVPVVGETLIEPNEDFVVTLSNPMNGMLADPQGIGTILDDDSIGGTWIPQGPGPTLNGQVENVQPNNEVVGAVHTVVAHPSDPNILWLGGVNGGIWRTTNAQDPSPNWEPLTSDYPALAIGAMELDPTDPTSQTLLAGIGRYSSFGQAGGARNGLLLSRDGGDTWSQITDPLLVGSNISGVQMRGNLMLASANFFSPGGGLYRSDDAGATWTTISGTGGLPTGAILDMVGDPTDLNRFYVAVREVGIFRSDDGGVNWVNISANDPGAGGVEQAITTGPGTNNNTEMAVGNGGRLFVAVLRQGQPNYIGFTSDQGATWSAMDLPQTMESNGDTEGLNPTVKPGGQGAIHFSIVVDPNTDDIVYAAGDRQDSPFPNFIGAVNFSGRIFRGNTTIAPTGAVPSPQWDHMTHSDNITAIPGGGTASSSSPHADSREMTFDAAGNLIETDDGGIYRRTSPGDNTGDWFSIIGDLQVTEFHDIAYDSNSDIIIGGAQDTGTPQQVTTGSFVWDSVSTADGGDVAVDDTSVAGQSTRYSSFQNLGAFRRRTYDAANVLLSQVFPALMVTGGGAALVPQFVTPVELNAVDQTRLIIGGANSTYESMDQGDTIAEVGPGIGVNRDAVAYGGFMGGTPNPDVLYVGSGSQVFVRTTMGGMLTATAYPGNAVRDIVLDPDDWMTAYVIDSNQVFQTTDAGTTWTDITGDLTDVDLRSIVYVPGTTDDAIMVGGRDGVFRTLLSSVGTWLEFGFGLPNTPVFDMDYDAADDVLIAGTLGRGAWLHANVATLVAGSVAIPAQSEPVNIGGPNDDTLLGDDGADTLVGSDFDDSLNGGAGDDLLDGGAGDDIMEGAAGKDTLVGNDGNDLLDGGRGSDTVSGGLGNDTVTWETEDGVDDVDGGLGFDGLEINTKSHNDRITVSAVGDGRFQVRHRIPSDAVGETVRGGMIEVLSIDSNGGADRITVEDLTGVTWLQQVNIDAGRGSDLVDASAQLNAGILVSVMGGTGADTVIGGAGNDFIDGNEGNDVLTGGDGADTLSGSAGVDKLFGSDGNDVLLGGDNRDFLRGEDGNDSLSGGNQNDDLFGGIGNDLLLGNAGDDSLLGEQGNDSADGGVGNDTVDGGDGNDLLEGNDGVDSLRGGMGNDTARGGADGDTIAGGAGNDLLLGGNGSMAFLSDGNDFINGNAGNDTLLGENGQDTLLGGAGLDDLDGGFGNDQINGNAGNDTMRGGNGNDLMRGGMGNDTLNGGHGEDRLFGQGGNDGLSGHDGHDRVNGGDGADTLHGGDGNDTLRGGAGSDLLIGHDGNDNLNGQGGDPDTLVGQDAFDILDDNGGLDVKDNDFVFFADWIDAA